MTELKLSFLEYGKYFEPNRTSDFFDLAYTEDMAGRSKRLRDALSMPDSQMTPFRYVAGKKQISAAFMLYEYGWFFAHIQARREDEKHPVSMNRPFYQTRFTHLDIITLQELFSSGHYGFFSLLRAGAYEKNAAFALKDHSEIEGKVEAQLLGDDFEYVPILESSYQKEPITTILSLLLHLLEKEKDGNKIQLRIVYDEKKNSLEQRLLLMDVIQQMIYPKYGWISFALDYVSSPVGTPPRIQFLSNEDTNYPNYPDNVKAENRQEIKIYDLKEDMNYVDNGYAKAVKTFINIELDEKFPLYEDLFSDRLRELIKRYDIGGFVRFLVLDRKKEDLITRYEWLSMKKNDFDGILEDMSVSSIQSLHGFLENISHPRVFQTIVRMARKQIPSDVELLRKALMKYREKPLEYKEAI